MWENTGNGVDGLQVTASYGGGAETSSFLLMVSQEQRDQKRSDRVAKDNSSVRGRRAALRYLLYRWERSPTAFLFIHYSPPIHDYIPGLKSSRFFPVSCLELLSLYPRLGHTEDILIETVDNDFHSWAIWLYIIIAPCIVEVSAFRRHYDGFIGVAFHNTKIAASFVALPRCQRIVWVSTYR
jgi:hypothetical protein